MSKAFTRMIALVSCVLLVSATMLPAFATMVVIDPHEENGLVILEDPALIGDLDEYMLNVVDELPEETEPPATEEPTQDPGQPPTSPPTAAYEIQMEPPSGWYANRAVMEMAIVDKGGTGWASVRVTMERSSGTVTLIDAALPSGHIWIDLLDNCTVEAVITDPDGGQHNKKVTVNCFDKGNPTLTASVIGEYLHIEATDSQSGIAAVQVNGTLYTELSDGKLKIWLKEYADAYEQLIVQAVDKVGNVSLAIAVANPFYKNTGTATPVPTIAPTPTPKPNTTPKPTAKPTATPKPTAIPKPTTGNGGGNSSGSSGTATATATPSVSPTPAIIPTPEPTANVMLPAASIEPGFPFTLPGNSFTRDLLYDRYTNKQFIAIETRGGDVFYIVIDYDKPLDDKGERYETYFLNLVDSRDMMDIVGETTTPEPEVIYVTPEPTVQPTPEPIQPEPERKDSGRGMLGIISILAAAGGGAFWYFKIRKPSVGKSKASFDDYDFEDDDDEDDEPEENEDE